MTEISSTLHSISSKDSLNLQKHIKLFLNMQADSTGMIFSDLDMI